MSYKKTIKLGKVRYDESMRYKANDVEIEIEIDDQNELHMVGAIWNTRHTDWLTGGQCENTISELFPNNAKVQRIVEVWREWHLNNMHAGTPAQEALIKRKLHAVEYPQTHYEMACDLLRANDLLIDNGYRYGSGWLKVGLPQHIIDEVKGW